MSRWGHEVRAHHPRSLRGIGGHSHAGIGRPLGHCPHSGTINGVSVLIACGPAKATLRFGAARLALRNGQYAKTSSNFGLTATLQIAHSAKQYIGEQ